MLRSFLNGFSGLENVSIPEGGGFFMNKLMLVLSGMLLCGAGAVHSADTIQSLRGNVPLDQERGAPDFKNTQRDRDPIPRDYIQQPPLIPHNIDRYQITRNHNKCMSCHSWSSYKQVGATKVSLTHFKDRAGTDMANVSPRRYFCTQCHVPQVNAKPLVENEFKPVRALRQ
jgi:cytochrome c-type protein NapB